MIGRIVIEDIRPQVDCGQFTTRAVAGETVPVEATIFRDGHNEVVAAAVRLTGPGDRRGQLIPLTEVNHGLHHWQGQMTLPRSGAWSFTIEAWTDEVATWRNGTQKKLDAGRDISMELEEGPPAGGGCRLGAGHRPGAGHRGRTGLRNEAADKAERLASAYDSTLVELLERNPPKDVTRSRRLGIWVDRPRPLRLLVRVLPPLGGPPRPRAERSSRRPSGSRPSPPWASTSSTCPQSTRSAAPQGPEQHPRPRPGRPGKPVGDRLGGRRARRHPPRPGHHRGLRRLRGQGQRAWHGDRPRLRAAVLARPSLGQGASGLVPDPARRLDRLR